MKQSRLMSLAESFSNVAIGYGIAVLTQIVVFPLFGIHASLSDSLLLGGVFTVVSIIRSYALRRLFETFRLRSVEAKRRSKEGTALNGKAIVHSAMR